MIHEFLIIGRYLDISVSALMLVFAWWKGGYTERICVSVIPAMGVVDYLYHFIFGHAVFNSIDIGHLMIDSSAALIFLTVAIQANRIYPIWLAAWQLVAVTSHLIRLIDPAIGQRAYATLIIAPSYFEMVILAVGLALHVRRVRIHGSYRDWRSSSNPLLAMPLPT